MARAVTLAARDIRSLGAFLRKCYAIRDFDALVGHVLRRLPRLVASQLTTYNEMNVATNVSQDWTRPAEIGSPERVRIWNSVMHEHPVLMHVARTRDGRARKISDFLSVDEYHRLALYGEHFGPQGVEDMMGIGLSATPDVVVGIAVHRSRRTFSERDRLVLNLLRPHLVQAYRNARAWTTAQQRMEVAVDALDATERGVMALTLDLRVMFVSECAARWVAAYFGQDIANDQLPAELRRWVARQQAVISLANEIAAPRGPLVKERHDRQLVVRLISKVDRLLLVLEEDATRIDPSRLEHLGLARRETEVLAWVTEGKTNREIAAILGLSPRTVQKHLERVFNKLGVETRTTAAALAIRAVRKLQ